MDTSQPASATKVFVEVFVPTGQKPTTIETLTPTQRSVDRDIRWFKDQVSEDFCLWQAELDLQLEELNIGADFTSQVIAVRIPIETVAGESIEKISGQVTILAKKSKGISHAAEVFAVSGPARLSIQLIANDDREFRIMAIEPAENLGLTATARKQVPSITH